MDNDYGQKQNKPLQNLQPQINQEEESFEQKEAMPPSFLEKIFADLETKKKQLYTKSIPSDTIYKGYKTIPIQKLQERQLYEGLPIDGLYLWKRNLVKTIHVYKQNCHLSYKHQNGFFKAFYDAYIQHGDIKITPDDVWLTIMIFFSEYVSYRSKKLRKAFVKHDGKIQLTVSTNEKEDEGWTSFLDKVKIAIKQATNEGIIENLECNFSSTDDFSRLFSSAMIMHIYGEYFQFVHRRIICGIQNIHMGGSQEDWENLPKKLVFLKQFDVDGQLKLYVNNLLPVLEQLVETYKGNAHIQFWNNIYQQRKNPTQSSYFPSFYINGWIIRFFTTDNELGGKLGVKEITVPIKHVIAGSEKTTQMYLVGGCRGVSVEDGKVYRPHYSFAILEKIQQGSNA